MNSDFRFLMTSVILFSAFAMAVAKLSRTLFFPSLERLAKPLLYLVICSSDRVSKVFRNSRAGDSARRIRACSSLPYARWNPEGSAQTSRFGSCLRMDE